MGVPLVSPSCRGQLTREVIDDGRFELVGAVDPDNVDASATPALISSQAISEGADAVMISLLDRHDAQAGFANLRGSLRVMTSAW